MDFSQFTANDWILALSCLYIAHRIINVIWPKQPPKAAAKTLELGLDRVDDCWYVYVNNQFLGQDPDLDLLLARTIAKGPAAHYRIWPGRSSLTEQELGQAMAAVKRIAHRN